MKDETAWLVETIESQNFNIHWLCAIEGNLTFQKDANKALRFARKEDAEAMCKLYVNCIAIEHMWVGDE